MSESNELISPEAERIIALEEAYKACQRLDQLRLEMLNEAVDWLMEETGMSRMEVRLEIAQKKGHQVANSLNTLKAVREVLSQKVPPKS